MLTLVHLLRDWLDKEKYPTVSFIHTTQTYLPSSSIGHVWVGDHDIGVIYNEKIEFGSRGTLYAADPAFFQKLQDNIDYAITVLKKYNE